VAVTSITVTLRPAGPGDDAFLRRVYASTREEELAPLPWSDDEKEAFLRAQFDAQAAHYRGHYEPASFDVVEADGRPVGRLYVARWEDEVRIMDLAILTEHRGAGVATHLLRGLLDEARESGKRLSIHVEKHNPALRLYERLGFLPVADKGVYLRMEAMP